MKSMPLEGKTLVVTRPRHQAKSFIEKIKEAGGEALVVPAIEVRPPAERALLLQAARELSTFDWVILTSVNGVSALLKALEEVGIDTAVLAERKIGAIGPATAKAIAAAVREPDVTPERYISDDIPELLGDVQGKKILLPRADIARKELSQELSERGAQVHDVPAYSIVTTTDSAVLQTLSEQGSPPDYFTFTSSSTVRGLVSLLKQSGQENWIENVPSASIGPITAQTVRELGLRAAITAEEYTSDGLLDAIVEYNEKHG